MKRLLGMARICATFGLVLTASAQEPLPEELEVVIVPGGQNLLVWQGQDDRTYFVQASDPDEPAGHLSSWLWMPVIDYGIGEEISHEVGSTAGRTFFRIWYTDAEWPDGLTLEEWDADGDGLSNAAEIDEALQTNPVLPDTDGDGLPDGWEVAHGLNPHLDDASGLFQGGPETNLGAFQAGVQADPNATMEDYDGDSILNGDDADPVAKDELVVCVETERIEVTWDQSGENRSTTVWTERLSMDRLILRCPDYGIVVPIALVFNSQGLGGELEKASMWIEATESSDVTRTVKFLNILDTDYPSYFGPNSSLTVRDPLEFVISAGSMQSQTIDVDPGVEDITQSTPDLDQAAYTPPVDIDADTNRDGGITADDEEGEDQWTDARGTIYAVNFDSDEGRKDGNDLGFADAITRWDDEQTPVDEHFVLSHEEDKEDITPFEITVAPLPDGSKVWLKMAQLEDLRAVHIFPRIQTGRTAILGGLTNNQADTSSLEVDITEWLQPVAQGENPPANGKIEPGTYQFGLEGLAFRGMKLKQTAYSGRIELRLEIDLPTAQQRIEADKIHMKVAPFLLAPNHWPTERVFVRNITDGLLGMPDKSLLDASAPTKWIQDHVEIGYTQRPGGPVVSTAFVCPYRDFGNNPVLAAWSRKTFLAANKGVFALGESLGADPAWGGDWGGNIELTHPQTDYPLGRIIAGSTIGGRLRAFFVAQELQSPIAYPDLSFTEVQHIDEVLSPGPGGKTWIPDPAAAVALLQTEYPVGQRLKGVLFSEDSSQPKITSVHQQPPATPPSGEAIYVVGEAAFDGTWTAYAGGFLRIVSGGYAGGQVAEISGIVDDGTGRVKFELSQIWNTAWLNPVANRRASQAWNAQVAPRQDAWNTAPSVGDSIVCVKSSKFWHGGCPAIITVKEVLDDADFVAFNQTTLPPLIQGVATAAGAGQTSGIPALFYKVENPPVHPLYAVAFSPNPANLQWVDFMPVNARPFGPRDGSGVDVLEEAIVAEFPGMQPMFLDDWSVYHVDKGEIHCGSAAERQADPAWWTK